MFKKKKQEEVVEVIESVETTVEAVETPSGIAKINNIKEEVVELPIEEVTL